MYVANWFCVAYFSACSGDDMQYTPPSLCLAIWGCQSISHLPCF